MISKQRNSDNILKNLEGFFGIQLYKLEEF